MNRSIFTAIVIGLVIIPQWATVNLARAAGDTDSDLWNAVGVTRLTAHAPAPAVVLNDLAGDRVDLQDLRGRLVMLYFWATW
jgi:hypothetical protein